MAETFTEIRQGKNGGLMLVARDARRAGNALVVELSRRTGEHYEVTTASRFRVGTIEAGTLLWERERRSTIAGGEAAGPLQRGGQSAANIAIGPRSSNTILSGQAAGGGEGRVFAPRAERYLDSGDPATLAARAEGEVRARLDALRRAIGEVNRAMGRAEQRRLSELLMRLVRPGRSPMACPASWPGLTRPFCPDGNPGRGRCAGQARA